MNKVKYTILITVGVFFLSSCGGNDTHEAIETDDVAEEQVEVVIEEVEPAKQVAENVNVEKFEYMVGHGSGLLLDVRTPEEFEGGHIEGAILINFFDPDFADQIEKLDKSRAVYVYCKSGGRSGRAMVMMKESGFVEVYNLIGGYSAWSDK